MAQKTVSLSEKAYEKLRGVKKEGESFSQVILRLIERDASVSILNFAGAFAEGSKEWESIEKEIYSRRKEKSRMESLMEDWNHACSRYRYSHIIFTEQTPCSSIYYRIDKKEEISKDYNLKMQRETILNDEESRIFLKYGFS